MTLNWKATLALTALAVVAGPALAHHSFAMFDQKKVVTISGTVKELQWTNPHVWLQVDVPTGGKVRHWSFEGNSPNMLRRRGWSSTVVKPGDKITVKFNPLKNGDPGGGLLSIVGADGKTR